MLNKYGYTCEEVERLGLGNIYKYINQNSSEGMDCVLAKTIIGLSDYIHATQPDMILIHGDRVEALAGAIVGALNNVLTGHIEGGEVSGTIDELIRHAVSKMSHVHFVANHEAKQRLIQLGERDDAVHVIGSPDIDIMNSVELPHIDEVFSHYNIAFQKYGIVAFHPVTTEVGALRSQTRTLLNALKNTDQNFVVIYPNNDCGSEIILEEYRELSDNPRFRIFPSMRFEFFLTLLKNANFIIGNSSAGVREAPHFGVAAVNLGTRQHNRVRSNLVVNADFSETEIAVAIDNAMQRQRIPEIRFGDGGSAQQFSKIISGDKIWSLPKQKHFIDRF